MGRPFIVWTWQDEHVEDEGRTLTDLQDMAAHGFAGVMIQLRGCRYQVIDPAVRRAVVRAVQQARAQGLQVWLCLDPRLAASELKRRTGEAAAYWIVAHGDDQSATTTSDQALPLDTETEIGDGGRIEIRLRYPARRPHHMHSDGALHFVPWRLDRVFAYQKVDPDTVASATLTDITGHCRLWIDHLTGAVEVFGRWTPPAADRPWYALAFILFDSNYPDFAGAATRRELCAELDGYAAAGIRLDGICWDEPGYATSLDPRFRADRMRLPGGEGIRRVFLEKTGRELLDCLPFLVRHDDAGTAPAVRRAYYDAVQEAVLGFQRELGAAARRLFGPATEIGIHATWHQNADDFVHGSGDWWAASMVLTGGFTDVGNAEELDRPEQVREIVSMLVMAGSLARHRGAGQAWINLWGVDFGEPGSRYPAEVVDYWVALMAVFGTRWLAHTYGPTSYFSRTTGWGPGYPHHPTWKRFPRLTGLCERVGRATGWRPPEADVLVVWPMDAMVRLGGPAANELADRAKAALVELVDNGLAVHVVPPRVLAEAGIADGRLVLGRRRYRGLVILEPEPAAALGDRLWAEQIPLVAWDLRRRDAAGIGQAALDAGIGALVAAPRGAYAGLWRDAHGTTVALCPQRFGQTVAGPLRWDGGSWEAAPTDGLLLVRWDRSGRLVERIEWHIGNIDEAKERTTGGERSKSGTVL